MYRAKKINSGEYVYRDCQISRMDNVGGSSREWLVYPKDSMIPCDVESSLAEAKNLIDQWYVEGIESNN